MARKQAPERTGDGVYSHQTKAGTRYHVEYRKSAGRSETQRGFASVRAAQRARERMVVSAARRERSRRPRASASTSTHGSSHESPTSSAAPTWATRSTGACTSALRPIKLTKLQTAHVEHWLASLVAEDRLAPATINNALVTLVACLNSALRRGKIVRNPAAGVQHLPDRHTERDYLRLDEIPRYLDSCSAAYRPLAEVLIATGMRIGEALAPTWRDVDVDNRAIRVIRARKTSGYGSTKGDRFRSVNFGPRIAAVLRDLRALQQNRGRAASSAPCFRGRVAGRRRRRSNAWTATPSRAAGTRRR
jgi:integrase